MNKNTINLWLYKENGVLHVYDKEMPNTEKIGFVLRVPDFGIWSKIEEASLENFKVNEHETIKKYNRSKMKLAFLRAAFVSWTFEEEMCFEDGILADASYAKLVSLHPLILDRLTELMDKVYLSDSDEEVLAKQSFQLFDSKSSGVSNPHPMISLYCMLSMMWDKFGLNYFDLQKFPSYERNALRRICEIENKVRQTELKAAESKRASHAAPSKPRRRR